MINVETPSYEALALRLEGHVAWLALNRPDKANAMNPIMWDELQQAFEWLDAEPHVRVVVLCGEGKHFCAGIDLAMFADLLPDTDGQIMDQARLAERFRQTVLRLQNNISAIERCRKPVIAAIHGSCLGGGVDLVSACDMRYCSDGAVFSIKEIDIGIVADVGTLQRLPGLIPQGVARELAFTGRAVKPAEAARLGLVNANYESYQSLIENVSELAQEIARKSPLAIRGTKQALLYARDHSVADALEQVATWNAGMLSKDDLLTAMQGDRSGEAACFKD
ncbi:enoyl-CoA hydratase/carnithine racemase [Spongiibacter sp. IMCC21906]|jgi:enoyl-CoA hydratase|uniref:crotonase/enoyl-CoA hydratase family protein n=1 Tax=Spongiibacter sp. IMCC21906 TaxID=1620392 RepID=UPI00062E0222|nr:crotonase/enoyl-CoA hydratase family protein [Spongiibacter sp. IMCC21906]AKH70181.1 enoyl-CoA hydratase/carnithine racemase [Spongiibacter sp. IMCC21906]